MVFDHPAHIQVLYHDLIVSFRHSGRHLVDLVLSLAPDLRMQTVHFLSLSVILIGTFLPAGELFLFSFELPFASGQISRVLIHCSI